MSLGCVSALGIAEELKSSPFAFMLCLVVRADACESLLVSVTVLFASLHRSAPAQPPAEGAEGAAPGGGPPGPPPNMTSNRRLQQTQAQVEEVGTWPIPESF